MPTAAVLGGASILGAITSRNASKKAVGATNQASSRAVAAQKQATTQARNDLFNIFPQAQQTAQQGFQGAIDVFNQSLPAQANVFQQGNIGAQNAILAGLPQIQNAILGGNVDLSQLQAFQPQQPDLSFLNQTLPPIQARNEQAAIEQQAIADQPPGLGMFFQNKQSNLNQPQVFQPVNQPLVSSLLSGANANRRGSSF